MGTIATQSRHMGLPVVRNRIGWKQFPDSPIERFGLTQIAGPQLISGAGRQRKQRLTADAHSSLEDRSRIIMAPRKRKDKGPVEQDVERHGVE